MTENKQNEIFKDVPNYEGLYQVSNYGNVKSLSRLSNNQHSNFTTKEKLLKPAKDKSGYSYVYLTNELKKSNFKYIHRLIALAFIENKKNKEFVNHIDGNKHNSVLENLEWCTKSENTKHAYKNGLMKPKKGEETKVSKLNESQVIEIRTSNSIGVGKTTLAKQFEVNLSTIYRIINRELWQHI